MKNKAYLLKMPASIYGLPTRNGLVVKSRDDLMQHNMPYAHDYQQLGFIEAIKEIKPHILIGATGAPGTFTQEVIETLSEIKPTSGGFCTLEPHFQSGMHCGTSLSM